MRSQLAEWYEPNDDGLRDILRTGTIALDANVLLDLYRFGDSLRAKVLDVLLDPQVRSRLFVPYQAALEYQRNRLDVGHDQSQRFVTLRADLAKAMSTFDGKVGSTIRDKDIRTTIKHAVATKTAELDTLLGQLEEEHALDYQTIRTDDNLRHTVDRMLADDGQIGVQPEQEELTKRTREGLLRYQDGVPTPGLADFKKGKPNPEGDYLIWRELLDHASHSDRPLLFVTGDTKDDWYRYVKGERLGPRTELRREMLSTTSHAYHQSTLDSFLLLAREHLGVQFDDSDVANVAATTIDNERSTRRPKSEANNGITWSLWHRMSEQDLTDPDTFGELLDIVDRGQIINTELLHHLMGHASHDEQTRSFMAAVETGTMIDTDTLASVLTHLSPDRHQRVLESLASSQNISAETLDRLARTIHDSRLAQAPQDLNSPIMNYRGLPQADSNLKKVRGAMAKIDPAVLRSLAQAAEIWASR